MKRYVRGDRFQEGYLEFQVVPGGYVVGYGTSLANCFVPDHKIMVFETERELEDDVEKEIKDKLESEIFWAPLTEGEQAWVDRYKEANPLAFPRTVELRVREFRLTGEPLIYSFGEKHVKAEDAQPMVGKRSWWSRLWGLD